MRFSKLSVFWGDSPSSTWSETFAVASSESFTSWEGQASAWSEAELRRACVCVADEGDSGDGCRRMITEMEPSGGLCAGPAVQADWLDGEAMGLVEWLSMGEAVGLAEKLSEGEAGMLLL